MKLKSIRWLCLLFVGISHAQHTDSFQTPAVATSTPDSCEFFKYRKVPISAYADYL